MRVFIAILFSRNEQEWLKQKRDQLKMLSKQGNFTTDDNLHLTLVFIGEVSNPRNITKIMDQVSFAPFYMKMQKIDKFTRNNTDTYYLSVNYQKTLVSLQSFLQNKLLESGFRIDERMYRPHITLGREVLLINPNNSFTNNEEQNVYVTSFALMKSERIKNKLIYTKIYEKKLEENK